MTVKSGARDIGDVASDVVGRARARYSGSDRGIRWSSSVTHRVSRSDPSDGAWCPCPLTTACVVRAE